MTRIFKPDSGQTLEIQDEGGSAALTIDTDGDIQIANDIDTGTFKGTIDSTATFPDGIVTDTKIYRAKDTDYLQSTSGTHKVCTSIDSGDNGQISFSAVSGNTYIFTYSQFQQCYRVSGSDTADRWWHGSMQVKDADLSIGDTNAGGEVLADGYILSGGMWGREMGAVYGSGTTSYVLCTYVGGYYASSTETLYVYLTSSPPLANHRVRSLSSATYPGNCVIQTIKGNVLTINTA